MWTVMKFYLVFAVIHLFIIIIIFFRWTGDVVGYCRPTVSTEDVARATPPPGFGPPLVLAYRSHPPTYVDQHGRAYVIQPPHTSREYVQAWSTR